MNLISLMICMFLSVLIGTVALQWLAITEHQYCNTKCTHHEIEKICTAFHYFHSEVKNSNFLASSFKKALKCNCRVALNKIFSIPYPRYEQVVSPGCSVFGFIASYENCNKLPDSIFKKIKPETEVFVIYNTPSVQSFHLMKPLRRISELDVPKRYGIWDHTTLLISDDKSCDFFVKDTSGLVQLGSLALRNINTSSSTEPELSKEYGIGSNVTPLHTVIYYIAEKEGRSSLYRRDLQREACDEILTGISKIEFQYSVYDSDSKDGKISYRKAEQVDNLKAWQEVKSVRIRITLQQENPILFRERDKRTNDPVWMLEVAVPNWDGPGRFS